MLNLKVRSYQQELLDADDIPFEDIRKNMQELNTINSLLGGHKITLAGLKHFIDSKVAGKVLTVCEIGCGGGDNLNAINNFCKKNNILVSFTGIDIKKECIDFAIQQYPHLNSNWITENFAAVDLTTNKPDIIFSSLFCHHFSENALVNILHWMKANSRQGFFINDLHRHRVAYYSIKLLTAVFSNSYLVKNDAPLSVARGFTRNEWMKTFAAAGIVPSELKWKWAFRHLIVYKNE